jgi:hypothetical protein
MESLLNAFTEVLKDRQQRQPSRSRPRDDHPAKADRRRVRYARTSRLADDVGLSRSSNAPPAFWTGLFSQLHVVVTGTGVDSGLCCLGSRMQSAGSGSWISAESRSRLSLVSMGTMLGQTLYRRRSRSDRICPSRIFVTPFWRIRCLAS